MKKLILIALMLGIMVSPGWASGVLPPKPPISDTPVVDNPNWTGIAYNGLPIRYASDAVGANINYLFQVAIVKNTDGSAVVQLYTKGQAPSTYGATKSNSLTTQGPANPTGIFQDSGIVLPRTLYTHSMFKDMDLQWNWGIIVVFKLNATQLADFRTGFQTWRTGKLSHTSVGSTAEYYWK